MQCNNCKFWYELLDDEKGNPAYGQCRRFPPTTKQTGEIFYVGLANQNHMVDCSKFEVITHAVNWCGEYVSHDPH